MEIPLTVRALTTAVRDLDDLYLAEIYDDIPTTNAAAAAECRIAKLKARAVRLCEVRAFLEQARPYLLP